jgi:hypothetical protein
MPHKLEYQVKAQLTAYSKKPSNLSSSLGKNHSIILGYIASTEWKDLYISSFDRDAKKYTAIKGKLELCKDIATFIELKIVPVNEQFDQDYNIKPAVIEYLAKYIIKRRANYLYIWTLFMQRDYELSSLNTIMQGKVNEILLKMSASPNSAPNLKDNMFTTTDIITKMHSVINSSQMSPEDKKRAFSMLQKHSTTATSVESVLLDFTVLLNECKNKLSQYKDLVVTVLPLMDQMAESTNNSELKIGPYIQSVRTKTFSA